MSEQFKQPKPESDFNVGARLCQLGYLPVGLNLEQAQGWVEQMELTGWEKRKSSWEQPKDWIDMGEAMEQDRVGLDSD